MESHQPVHGGLTVPSPGTDTREKGGHNPYLYGQNRDSVVINIGYSLLVRVDRASKQISERSETAKAEIFVSRRITVARLETTPGPKGLQPGRPQLTAGQGRACMSAEVYRR